MGDYVSWRDLAEVVLVSLLGGAGIVVLYAFGIRAVAAGQEEGRRGATAVGVLSFTVVILGVVLGLYVMLHKD